MSEYTTLSNDETVETPVSDVTTEKPASETPISDIPVLEMPEEPDEMEETEEAEPAKPKCRLFPFHSVKSGFSRDEWILTHIDSSQLMEYLNLEQKRFEQLQEAKERKEKRLFTTFKLAISLAAIVAVIALLKDVPTILVNILYIAGILAAFWFWKNPKDNSDK